MNKCMVCNEDHSSRNCPDLYGDLESGFYKGAGHSHANEEENTIAEQNVIHDMSYDNRVLLFAHRP